MPKAEIFLIEGVREPFPMGSYAIPCDSATEEEEETYEMCRSCFASWYRGPQPVYISGFDDFLEFDETLRAFVNCRPPLITSREFSVLIADHLTGIASVRVGYGEWNQEVVLRGDGRFARQPLLGALFATGRCVSARDARGDPIRYCRVCGHLPSLEWSSSHGEQQVFPERDGWDGTDVFLMDGFTQDTGTIVTNGGLQRLAALGFENLRLTELAWA